METVLKALGVVITRDENGNIIDSTDGTPDIHMLTAEYNEWITNASRRNEELFRGKTRVEPSRIGKATVDTNVTEKAKSKYQLAERGKYITGRKLGSQTIADMQDIETIDKDMEEMARQQRAISQTKENQYIGE